MDDIVKQAIAKWPNVPHCYGWLGLDARGAWRMRDERAQHLGLAGERIVHPALLGFIARNYDCDAQGRWYFQNGPQRVYVNLEATPYIARTDPARGLVLQTDATLDGIEAAWLTETGALILKADKIVAQLDDRDAAQWMGKLFLGTAPAADEALLDWLETGDGDLHLRLADQLLAVGRLRQAELAAHFGYVAAPAAD